MIFEKLLLLFQNAKINFRHIHHVPTHTCEESAAVRGEPLEIGAKAMVMKMDDAYNLFVLSASKKIDTKKVKALVPCKSMRFATPEELFQMTSLLPGSVPPFGNPIMPFNLFVDASIQQLPNIAFNAGSLSDSIVISSADYLNLCHGTICAFSK